MRLDLSIFTILALGVTIAFIITLQLLICPLKYILPNVYHALMLKSKALWVVCIMTLLQVATKTSFHVHTKQGFPDLDRVIVISNHQLYADWMYLWLLLYHFGKSDHFVIIMKQELSRIPFVSWGMRNFDFIFLSRRWAVDRDVLKGSLLKMRRNAREFWLLLFPEGTTLHPTTIEKSNSHAVKQSLEPRKHVLLPRSTGLFFCLGELAQPSFGTETLQGLVDVTVCVKGIARSDKHQNEDMETPEDVFSLVNLFFKGKQPEEVHFYVDFIPASEIPGIIYKADQDSEADKNNQDVFQTWLLELYRKKDVLLDNFYNDRSLNFTNSKEKECTEVIAGVTVQKRRYIVLFIWIMAPLLFFKLLSLLQTL